MTKYLKLYNTDTERTSFESSANYEEPYTGRIKNTTNIFYNKNDRQGGQILPYDAEIEFIQNSESQCIITNYVPTGPNIKIQGKFTPINYTAAYTPWFQAYTSENADSYRIIRHNTDNNSVYYTCGSKAGGSGSHTVSLNTTYVFEMTRNSLTLNGTVKTFTPTAGTANTGKLAIFCSTSKGSFTRGKLYYFKIWDSELLIFDFIPVRIGQTGYLYDKVSNSLFSNAGTGNFTLGPDV